MEKQVFLIDIDGVACEHAKAICKRVNQDFNLEATADDVKSWAHNFGPLTFVQAVKRYYPEEKFIIDMDVTPYFKDFLDSLEKKMLVKFASARSDYCRLATRKWVNKYFGDRYEIISSACKILEEFDYLIEDHLPEIICAADRGKRCFLLRQPWNDNKETRTLLKNYYKSAYYVESFSEVQDLLNRM